MDVCRWGEVREGISSAVEAERDAEALEVFGVETLLLLGRMVLALVTVSKEVLCASFAAAGWFALYPFWQAERHSR